MVQLRQDYDKFVALGTEVVAIGPDSRQAFQDFWKENAIPFIGLADSDNQAARLYEQEVSLLKLGRMPAQLLIDKEGIVQFAYYSNSMSDITENDLILEKVAELK